MVEEHFEARSPTHHSQKSRPFVSALWGLLGGVVLFGGVGVWYFTQVDPLGLRRAANSKPATAKDEGALKLETGVVEIVPFSELHVKIVGGQAVSIEAPQESGLTAKAEGKTLTVRAGKEAQPGPHEIKVRGAKGEETILKVNVKK